MPSGREATRQAETTNTIHAKGVFHLRGLTHSAVQVTHSPPRTLSHKEALIQNCSSHKLCGRSNCSLQPVTMPVDAFHGKDAIHEHATDAVLESKGKESGSNMLSCQNPMGQHTSNTPHDALCGQECHQATHHPQLVQHKHIISSHKPLPFSSSPRLLQPAPPVLQPA